MDTENIFTFCRESLASLIVFLRVMTHKDRHAMCITHLKTIRQVFLVHVQKMCYKQQLTKEKTNRQKDMMDNTL